MSFIETVDLYQKIGKQTILKNISLKAERGEVLGLIGPTGAGKTTLLRLLGLIDTPFSGTITIDGVDTEVPPKKRLQMRRRMAFVLQKPIVFNMSVYDNVACGLKWRRFRKEAVQERVYRILETVGLIDDKDRNARTLSGGEVQRVAIARALATGPEILILDEPTANLDPPTALRIEELISGIIRQHTTTIIMSTHDMAQGQRLADKIGVLVKGEIVQTGTSSDVFESPENREIASFVGVENIIEGRITASENRLLTIRTGEHVIEAVADYPVGDEVFVCIRPEDVTLALSRLSTSARNSYAGKIIDVVSMGPLARVSIDCGFPLVALITRRSADEMDVTRGRGIFANFKATAIHIIKKGD